MLSVTPEALDWIRTHWIPALRSGAYEQGKGCLRNKDDMYCCLGVACDLAIQDGMLGDWIERDSLWAIPVGNGRYADGVLPSKLAVFLGMDRYGNNVPVKEFTMQVSYGGLSVANDRGVPFTKIADALEAWCARQEGA